jgi:hypothetical protein
MSQPKTYPSTPAEYDDRIEDVAEHLVDYEDTEPALEVWDTACWGGGENVMLTDLIANRRCLILFLRKNHQSEDKE